MIPSISKKNENFTHNETNLLKMPRETKQLQ